MDIATAQRFQQQQIDAVMMHQAAANAGQVVGMPQSAPCIIQGNIGDQLQNLQDQQNQQQGMQHAERFLFKKKKQLWWIETETIYFFKFVNI